MHYPVMTEKHLADRWQVSLKTLRRWRLDNEGPVWHKLFRHVRYHEADVLEFEHRSSQHLMTLLGIKRETKPETAEVAQGLDAKGAVGPNQGRPVVVIGERGLGKSHLMAACQRRSDSRSNSAV
ncbi:MAG: hypothetical protein IPH26_17050 [Sterolibacteriaceae bacterium]|uniref:Uncharacterized protein n=1 Tax=Candidatus Methylophosphatis roskildensis TaxID=2899263 RepID=A0A9D7E6E5_9PROT|nr:hypothetical protein [Candidatus Methylophosphatis roskildensis]